MPSSRDLPAYTSAFFPTIYLNNQLCTKPTWPSKDTNLSGKVALITGANQGLGLESARQILKLGLSHLIISVRNTTKGEEAARTLRNEYPKATFDVYEIDMSSYDSIRAFAAKVALVQRLDIAILNAGVMNSKFKKTESTGHEETLQVNYLSTVLLSVLLLPTLKAKSVGGPGRMTIVSSGLAYAAEFKTRGATPVFAPLDDPKNFSADTYNVTKMLLMMYLYKLTDYVKAEDTIVNLVDPGYVKGTSLQRDHPRMVMLAMKLMDVTTARTVEVGASCYVDAVVIQGKESHGSYVMGWKVSP